MIDYEVKDLLKIVIRKWYVIVLAVAVFSLISVPMSRKSYQQAIEDYNRLLNGEENIDEQEEQEILEQNASFCIMKVESINNAEISDVEATNIVYQLLNNPSVLAVINSNVQWDDPVNVENANSHRALSIITNSNAILINSNTLSEKNFSDFILEIERIIKTDLDDVVGQQIEIQLGNIVSQMIPEVEDELIFGKSVIQEPSEMASYVKNMITAGVLGILVGVLAVLVCEYIKANRRPKAAGER